jgi:hypothetical protein
MEYGQVLPRRGWTAVYETGWSFRLLFFAFGTFFFFIVANTEQLEYESF